MNSDPNWSSLNGIVKNRRSILKQNRFTGPISDLSNLTALKLLFLSENRFSDEFPASLISLSNLYRLDLSRNRFFGEIPLSVNRLTHLLTLRLEENSFSGAIPDLHLPNLQEFNVSGNKFPELYLARFLNSLRRRFGGIRHCARRRWRNVVKLHRR
ncbi:probable leucine-rich repeat receptor-like protein kinase At1g68400 [Salvia hispanica]|uniref:probable leucine-rich repeat receptor-like protein kinase At1g68400 n=1 Tax=Salvia hispanica TaxID=49212 RepID=UPI00200950E5|nr:probable leucine-rich repeat receptor-like protein kinase At1g68400 [Salvia hispanica]